MLQGRLAIALHSNYRIAFHLLQPEAVDLGEANRQAGDTAHSEVGPNHAVWFKGSKGEQ